MENLSILRIKDCVKWDEIVKSFQEYNLYYLSGFLSDYRNFAPTNLLLYEAACWGSDQGFKIFHLGGGVGSMDDNLYKFKAGFNKKSNHLFSIGKMIFDQDAYNHLTELRIKTDDRFDPDSSFFPLYRA